MNEIKSKTVKHRLLNISWAVALAGVLAITSASLAQSGSSSNYDSDYYGPTDNYGLVEDDLFFDDPWYDAGDVWSDSDWEWNYYYDEPYRSADYDFTSDNDYDYDFEYQYEDNNSFNDLWDYGWYDSPYDYGESESYDYYDEEWYDYDEGWYGSD